jgi:hypothetical protein
MVEFWTELMCCLYLFLFRYVSLGAGNPKKNVQGFNQKELIKVAQMGTEETENNCTKLSFINMVNNFHKLIRAA